MRRDCKPAEEARDSVKSLPTSRDDIRRHPRFAFRSHAKAKIHPPPGSVDTGPAIRFVLTRDLSRSGVGILHTEQLFPGQRIEIFLSGQAGRWIEVMWCRQSDGDGFDCGCKFVRSED